MSGQTTVRRRGGLGKKGKVERRRAQHLARSTEIPIAAAETLILSAAFAGDRGMRLNRFMTIAFAANHCPYRTQLALGRLLKLAGDWLRTKGVTPAYVWVIESPADADEHVHLLIHVPDELKRGFTRKQRGWIAKTGTRFGKGVVRTNDIPDTREALTGLLRYILKGGDRTVREWFRIEHRGPQGVVEGKRCGVSQSIGCKARKRLGGVLGPQERPAGGSQDLRKLGAGSASPPEDAAE